MLPNVNAIQYNEVKDRIQNRIEYNFNNINFKSILNFLINYYVICYIICFLMMVIHGPLSFFIQKYTIFQAFILSFVFAFFIMMLPIFWIGLLIYGPALP
jgi:uncharacterized membrane protein